MSTNGFQYFPYANVKIEIELEKISLFHIYINIIILAFFLNVRVTSVLQM